MANQAIYRVLKSGPSRQNKPTAQIQLISRYLVLIVARLTISPLLGESNFVTSDSSLLLGESNFVLGLLGLSLG